MAVEINAQYVGNLRVEAIHGPSGIELHTDPPTDNGGRGESFSPPTWSPRRWVPAC